MPTQEVARVASPARLLDGPEHRPGAVLLDGGGPESWGDGRILYTDTPCATLEVYPTGWGRWRSGGRIRWRRGSPPEQWQDFVSSAPSILPAGTDRDAAGVLTVFSYDLKHWIERLPRRLPWPDGPVVYAALYDWRYAASHRTEEAFVAAASGRDLAARARWCESEPFGKRRRRSARGPVRCPEPATSREDYLDMVERARRYIAAGDIYQVNLAQRFFLPGGPDDAADLFASWCGGYPAPFAAYVDAGSRVIVSNSPECFLRIDGRRVSTFPIKGTRRGGEGEAAERLASDPKERAEHVMIVDLERNDLGRVCETGSVEVATFAAVRAYPLLVHMVSEVRGYLRTETSLGDVLRATFPGGSITGAPKIRAMEIIEELEPSARGVYTGAIGWMELDGSSCFNLPIRTAELSGEGVRFHAGGGIVADSDPEREYEESLLKSETFFRSLAAVRRGE